MSDITAILNSLRDGKAVAVDQLVPLVYDELRRLAQAKLAHERPGITLQTTALVNEAYLRLFGSERHRDWVNSKHFYCAAAEAMRRILIENARRRTALKRGGNARRQPIEDWQISEAPLHPNLMALDEALEELAKQEPEVVELLKLRYFAGLTNEQAASAMGIAPRTAAAWWTYARAWLKRRLQQE